MRLSPPSSLLRASPLALLASLALAPALGCGCGGASDGDGARQPLPRFAGAAFPAGVRAHGFALLDQDARLTSLGAFKGHVALIAFLSSDPRAATLAAQQVRGALEEVGRRASDVGVLLIASPQDAVPRRGPGAVRRRAGAGAALLRDSSLEGRARYLTAARRELQAVWKDYGVVLPSAGKRAFLASPTVLLVDRAGFERVGFALEQLTPEGLAHDLLALLESA